MAEIVKKNATYDDLYGIPERMTGEIIDSDLIVSSRPPRNLIFTASVLGGELGYSYQLGRGGGPGGWIILYEPEIKLGENILVPDLAGWRKERFPKVEEHNSISVAPDWVCEVLSPSTLRVDKIRKMPIYAGFGVQYMWLIDPAAKTLDVFRLESGAWVVAGFYVEDDKARAEPFTEIESNLGYLWLENMI